MTFPRPNLVAALLSAVLLASGFFTWLAHPAKPVLADKHQKDRPAMVVSPGQRRAPITVERPIDCSESACMSLTFDDGPDDKNTRRVLDVLRARHVRATFFVVGRQVARHPEMVRLIHQEGHEIGNHSWSHADLTKLTPAQIEKEVNDTQSAVLAAGAPAPVWFRPPYGAMDAAVRAHAGLALGLWNVDPEDWAKKDPKAIREAVSAHAGRGRIVDLHDMHGPTADALPSIIDDLAPHYHLVTMSELFNAGPGASGEFYGR